MRGSSLKAVVLMATGDKVKTKTMSKRLTKAIVGKLLPLTMITLLLNLPMMMMTMDLVLRAEAATTLKKTMARLLLSLPMPTVELVLQETTMTQEKLLVRLLNLIMTLEKSMMGQVRVILRPIPSLIMKVRKRLRVVRECVDLIDGRRIKGFD